MSHASVVNGEMPSKKLKTPPMGKVTVVIGAQWGDEGKGKLVDLLATKSNAVCRCQVSWNFPFSFDDSIEVNIRQKVLLTSVCIHTFIVTT
jgi:hypothetical protein